MSDINEKLIRKYQGEDRIIKDFYRVKDPVGKTVVVDGIVNPLKVDNRQLCSPTDNQEDKPACAAYSACTLVESLLWKMTGRLKNFNSDQVYALAKTIDGSRDEEGTYLEYSLKAVLDLCSKDSEFSFLKNARTGLFYNDRTQNTVETAKFLIHKYDILQVGFNIDDAWYSCTERDFILRRGTRSLGGHAVNLVGYSQSGFYVLNQWGRWGAKGFAIMPYDVFLQELMYGAYLYNITF